MVTVESERLKYWKAFSWKPYRKNCPGERLATYFRGHIKWNYGDTVIDLGCGTGRAGAALAAKQFNVTLFDLLNAVDPDINLPFIEGNIWDLSALPVFDWIYCADVLEHVPPEQVDNTLTGMARITRKGGLLSISHIIDECGKQIDEQLHLTIKPPSWWREKIEKLWTVTSWEVNHPASMVILGRPKQ